MQNSLVSFVFNSIILEGIGVGSGDSCALTHFNQIDRRQLILFISIIIVIYPRAGRVTVNIIDLVCWSKFIRAHCIDNWRAGIFLIASITRSEWDTVKNEFGVVDINFTSKSSLRNDHEQIRILLQIRFRNVKFNDIIGWISTLNKGNINKHQSTKSICNLLFLHLVDHWPIAQITKRKVLQCKFLCCS